MENYLESVFHQKIISEEYRELYGKLPLMFRGLYEIDRITMDGLSWIALKPRQKTGLSVLRKDYRMVQSASGMEVAVVLSEANNYAREKMLEEGISFVIIKKQIYLPFLGVLLMGQKEREPAPVNKISFLCQKIILMAIYENWNELNVTRVAEKLGVSKMSVSRCFDEMEYLELPALEKRGKSRVIMIPKDKETFWREISSFIRDPVINRFEFTDDIRLSVRAGMSSLAEYSLISDNAYPTYGIAKKDIREVRMRSAKIVSKGEPAGCVVLELGYIINYHGKGIIDPLSTMLSITPEERNEDRVSIAIENMIKEYVW